MQATRRQRNQERARTHRLAKTLSHFSFDRAKAQDDPSYLARKRTEELSLRRQLGQVVPTDKLITAV